MSCASDFLVIIDDLLIRAQNAPHCTSPDPWAGGEEIVQIYQGNFVADIEPIRNKRQTTLFRVRVMQLRPVELLITDSIATDAHAARERAEAKLREVLGREPVLKKAA